MLHFIAGFTYLSFRRILWHLGLRSVSLWSAWKRICSIRRRRWFALRLTTGPSHFDGVFFDPGGFSARIFVFVNILTYICSVSIASLDFMLYVYRFGILRWGQLLLRFLIHLLYGIWMVCLMKMLLRFLIRYWLVLRRSSLSIWIVFCRSSASVFIMP